MWCMGRRVSGGKGGVYSQLCSSLEGLDIARIQLHCLSAVSDRLLQPAYLWTRESQVTPPPEREGGEGEKH